MTFVIFLLPMCTDVSEVNSLVENNALVFIFMKTLLSSTDVPVRVFLFHVHASFAKFSRIFCI